MGKSLLMTKSTLPKYDAPPVVETVLGVEFSGLDNWGVPHFGLFWDRIRDRFPKWNVKAPLQSQIDNENGVAPTNSVQILPEPEMRCWFVGENDTTLIQIQKDRLLYNWRKVSSDDKYPHYDETVRPAFENIWTEFIKFVNHEQLGNLNVLQCEVSYINHLEAGSGWESNKDIDKVFANLIKTEQSGFLPTPDVFSFDSAYKMPENLGNLRVSAKPAIRNSDGTDILQLSLTSHVKHSGNDLSSIMEHLDIGREWIVRGFTDLTTPEMHKIWKRRI